MQRFFKYSRTEPARTVLFVLSLLFLVSQIFTLTPWYVHPDIEAINSIRDAAPPFGQRAPNAILLGALSGYGLWSAFKNNAKHMSWSSLALFSIFLLAAFTRALFAPDALNLLWLPYLGLSLVMAVEHIYMEGVRKGVPRE